MSKTGTCCVCGVFGQLTFEHVPPRAAFNDSRVFEADIHAMLANDNWTPGMKMPGRVVQKGAGRFTLCEKCNANTGSWYGPSYVEFAKRAMHLTYSSKGEMSLAYPYDIRPLKVLKQIAAMFMSACGPDFQKNQPDLARFVLDKERQRFPKSVQFYAYLHHPTRSRSHRQSGLSGVLLGANTYYFSEIAFPPFGFVMSIDRPPIDHRLLSINYFSDYRYVDRATVYLKLSVLPVVSALPADFRDELEIASDMAGNKKLRSYFLDPPADWKDRR